MPKWIENVSAFTEALPIEYAPLILGLSDVPWESPQRRDDFIKLMTGDVRGEA
jgi:hypothetical protein